MKTAARKLFATVAALGLLSACSGGDAKGNGGGGGGVAGTGGDGGGIRSPGDRSEISFVDNLLVKVAAGDWTVGEGLVATLKLFAGELDAASVLRHLELVDREGTGILVMAHEYLEAGRDAEATAEIRRLLERLVFSNEQLEAMAGLGAAKGAEDEEEDCLKLFGDDPPPDVGPCLLFLPSVELDELYPGDYRVFYPAESSAVSGWSDHHYNLVLETLEEAVPVFKELGKLPPVNIVFSFGSNDGAWAEAVPKPGMPCNVILYVDMQDETDGDIKQIIAHELAHCFQAETFPEQNQVYYEFIRWREEGLANHLSNVVYPENNLEWKTLPILAKHELTSTLVDRSYSNSLFFQYLSNGGGEEGIFDLVETLPTDRRSGRPEQESKLGAYPGIDNTYQNFAKAMTDEQIQDTSGALVPYEISEMNRPTVVISGPRSIQQDFEPFGVSRYRFVVEESKQASFVFTGEGSVRESARLPIGFDWMDIPSELPDDDCNREIIVVVTTHARNTGFELEVPEVQDLEASCGLEGEWLVDNDSLQFKGSVFVLDYITGEIRITFRADGNAEVVYDNFEYRTYNDVGPRDVGGVDLASHDQLTHTTNAQGVTSYEVDGERINFGDIFEASYLEGTHVIHQIKMWTPSGYIPDTDETTTQDPSGWGVFGGSPGFELQGTTLFLFDAFDKVEAVLNRIGPADG